jgi:hypothetical protein
VRAIIRWRRGKPYALEGRKKLLSRIVVMTAFVDLVFVGGFILVALQVMGNLSIFDSPLDPWLHLYQALGILAVIGAGVAIYNLVLTWRDDQRGWPSRIWAAAVVLACLGIVWIGFAFHLIGWSVEY